MCIYIYIDNHVKHKYFLRYNFPLSLVSYSQLCCRLRIPTTNHQQPSTQSVVRCEINCTIVVLLLLLQSTAPFPHPIQPCTKTYTATTIASTEMGEGQYLHRGSRVLNIDDRGVIVEDTTSVVSGSTAAGASAMVGDIPTTVTTTTPKRGPSKHYLSGTCLSFSFFLFILCIFSRFIIYGRNQTTQKKQPKQVIIITLWCGWWFQLCVCALNN